MNIFPIYCILCQKESDSYICNYCIKKLEYTLPICPVCKKISSRGICHNICFKNGIYQLQTGYKYTKIAKKVMRFLKYKGCIQLLDILFENYHNIIDISDNTILIPVPMYRTKRLNRGFNLSEEITKRISMKYKYNYGLNIIHKVKNLSSQTKIERYERVNNVENSFKVVSLDIMTNYDSILIVDDVITTQATINEIIKVIRDVNTTINIKVFSLFSAIK